MLMIIIWIIVLIIDIATWGNKYYTGFDLVVRDFCIIVLAMSLFALR